MDALDRLASKPCSLLLVLVALAAGSACASLGGELGDIRHFPEYGGYLPVSTSGQVRVDWLLPEDDDGVAPPTVAATAEEVQARVDARSDLGDGLVAGGKFLLLANPVTVLVAFGMMPLSERLHSRLEREARQALLDLADLDVSLRVVDEAGRPVADARMLELVMPLQFLVHGDASGRRSFAMPRTTSYHLPQRVLDELRACFPAAIHREVALAEAYRAGDHGLPAVTASLGPPETHPLRSTDASGGLRYRSLATANFVELGPEDTWVRVAEPSPVTLVLLVWAPGHEPALHAAPGLVPGRAVDATVRLQPIPGRERVVAVVAELDELLDALPRAVRRSSTRWSISGEWVESALARLGELAQDDTLPAWLQHSIHRILRDLLDALDDAVEEAEQPALSWKRKSHGHVRSTIRAARQRWDPVDVPWGPYLRSGPDNPWSLYQELLDFRMTAGGRWSEDDRRLRNRGDWHAIAPRGASPNPAMADRARQLLERAEALDPAFPELEAVRAILALAEADVERARGHARHLEHGEYLYLFYGLDSYIPSRASLPTSTRS